MEEKIRKITNEPIPTVLFKYRDWSNKYHKRIITEQEIYFPSPSEFNDPFDGNIPIRWDKMTYEDCFQKNLELMNIMLKNEDQEQVRAYAKKITDEKKLWHPDKLKKERPEQIKKWDSIIGLYALSELKDNILMWSHYSLNHTGFVVGLSVTSLIKNYDFDYIEPINYQIEYPFIDGNEDNTLQFYKKFFYKSEDWRYEKEWRISKNHIENRVVKLTPDTITEIIIGCRMDNKSKEDLIKKSKNNLGDGIQIYLAKKHQEDFKLEFERIN